MVNWIAFKEQKPKSRKNQYLVEYGWDSEISIVEVTNWDGKRFKTWDHYNDCELIINNPRYWCEINNPK